VPACLGLDSNPWPNDDELSFFTTVLLAQVFYNIIFTSYPFQKKESTGNLKLPSFFFFFKMVLIYEKDDETIKVENFLSKNLSTFLSSIFVLWLSQKNPNSLKDG
jgi:hypothetical protein